MYGEPPSILAMLTLLRTYKPLFPPSDTTVILGTTTTVLDTDFIPEDDIKPDPNMVKTEPEQSTFETTALNSPIKREPAESYSEILTSHSLNCELHMQITNIISLRGDDSSTDTAEYSMDSTIMGGNLTPLAHLLNSSSQTNDDQHPTFENSALQDVTQSSLGTLQDVTASDVSCKILQSSHPSTMIYQINQQ